MLRFGALVLAAMLTSADAAPPPELAVLLVEFRADAKFIGFPRHCPGATPEEDASPDMICTAALYEGPVHVVRQIGGSRSVYGDRMRYTAHAYSIPAGGRLLVRAYRMPDEPGMFATWWKWPDENGEICIDAAEAKAMEIEARWLKWRARTIIGEGDGKAYPVRCLKA
ncbi:MAG: hypothetical protein ACAH11_06615 [Sphingomonas sp.]